MKNFKTTIFTLLAILFLLAGTVFADNTVTLTWAAPLDADLAGFELHQTTIEGEYLLGSENAIEIIPVGTETVTITEVPDGTYYWIIVTFDTSDNKGPRSNEVSATLDSIPPGAATILQIIGIVKTP